MYLLKQVQDFENCEQIQALFSDLPKKPYCTDFKGFCHIRIKKQAIKHTYIQPNHPAVVKWLVFDIDDANALFAFYDNNAPRPQLIIKNPHNGHAHYCYRLSEKVGLWGNSSQDAIGYLRAVYKALQRKLGADSGYSGNLIKNPIHSNWDTYITGAKPSYTLAELAEFLDLSTKKEQKPANDDYFGRNCAVFHATRHQAYRIASKCDYGTLYNRVLAIAKAENARFDDPMDVREVHHIAKSITRFCKSPRFGKYSANFIEKQRREGRNGAIKANTQSQACSKGGLARSAKYNEQRHQASKLREQGLKLREIADILGVSDRTIKNWLKAEKKGESASQSDNSPEKGFLAEQKKKGKVPANQIIAQKRFLGVWGGNLHFSFLSGELPVRSTSEPPLAVAHQVFAKSLVFEKIQFAGSGCVGFGVYILLIFLKIQGWKYGYSKQEGWG